MYFLSSPNVSYDTTESLKKKKCFLLGFIGFNYVKTLPRVAIHFNNKTIYLNDLF